MRLKRQAFKSESAANHRIQASHREDAVKGASDIVLRAANSHIDATSTDPVEREFTKRNSRWLVDLIIENAWIREYHEWEKTTKAYFAHQHQLNNSPAPDFNKEPGSHVEKIVQQLSEFSIVLPPEILLTIDSHRENINNVKHSGDSVLDETHLCELHAAISDFWNKLESEEEFFV